MYSINSHMDANKVSLAKLSEFGDVIKCARCHSKCLREEFGSNRIGQPYRTCQRCRKSKKLTAGRLPTDLACTAPTLTNYNP